MMKKLLLLAVVAIVAMAANAQDDALDLTKVWQTTAPAAYNCRQGIALNGKFLINNKVEGIVTAYDEESATEMFDTDADSSFPAIAKDEAGNVIVRVDNNWPGSFMADTILFKIFPANGGYPIDVEGNIFADFESENGRMDYMGSAEGNLLEDGALYLVTSNSTGVLKVPFVDGMIDDYGIQLIPVSGDGSEEILNTTGTVVEPWIDADGNRHYMMYYRSAHPIDMIYDEVNKVFDATRFTLPGRANMTGIKPFSRDGKNLVAYSLKPEDRFYGDGFAIAEMNAEEPLFKVDDSGLDLTNGGVCAQWLDIDGDYLFQYAPSYYIACYHFGQLEEQHTYAVCGSPAALFSMENDWDAVAAPEMWLNDDNIYQLLTAQVALPACDISFKVIKDHSWDVTFPMDNYVIPSIEAGIYQLFVTFDPATNEVNAVLTKISDLPAVQTESPIINGHPAEGVNAYIVEITPAEPSTIYYRVKVQDDEFSAWAVYTDVLSFTANGHYYLEAYAVAPGKDPSKTEYYDFTIQNSPVSDINELANGHNVANVRYFNAAGQELAQPEGLTIMVTTYTDGTTSAVKVIK